MEGGVRFNIQAIHGLDVQPYTNYTNEYELLLDQNAQMKITGIEYDPKKFRWNVTMEQLPPQPRTEETTTSIPTDTETPTTPEPKKKGWWKGLGNTIAGLFGKNQG